MERLDQQHHHQRTQPLQLTPHSRFQQSPFPANKRLHIHATQLCQKCDTTLTHVSAQRLDSCEPSLGTLATGPDIWRLNTLILHDKDYTMQLAAEIKEDLHRMRDLQLQDTWDHLKASLMEKLK